MSRKFQLLAAFALVASTFSVTLSAMADEHEHQYYPFANDEFHEVWERTDYPVEQLETSRTWLWGPGANHPDLIEEEYAEAEDDTRGVQYTDKSRMEWPWSEDADPESPWFITQGLLATELMTGQLQIGDDSFEQHLPAERPAAGDPDDVTGPTYRAMGMHIDREPRPEGGVITEVIDRTGVVTEDESSYADYNVTDEYYIEDTDKNIASVFWDFMQSEGMVYVDGEFVEEDLFQDEFYAIGYPKTDAFWASVKVDGDVQDVLVQCFERRCLTYTPGNEDGWEVESGNIGQHYYNWRYDTIDRDAPILPDDGAFTFEGESEAAIDTGESAALTAEVYHGDFPMPDVDVDFEVVSGDDNVSLDADSAATGSGGNVDVNVTGDAEGVADVMAYVDLNDDGMFVEEDDLDLGVVEVTVVDDDADVLPDDGSFSADGESTAEIDLEETVDMTALVTANDDPYAGANVNFQVTDGVGVGEIDVSSGVTDIDGTTTVTLTGQSAGEVTVNAYVDVEETGTFDAGTDIDLGNVVVTVVDIEANGS